VQTTDAISSVSVTAHAACALLLALTFAYLSRLLTRPYLRRRELAAAVAGLRAARDQLAEQAHVDPLTGARNRRAFQALLESAEGLPAGGRGTLAMIDLDHLKEINDTAGHGAGDAAICAAAEAIRRLLRDSDLLFRWGGDEFLALLPGRARAEAEALLAPLGAGAQFGPSEHHLHLTWGIAELDGPVTEAAIKDAIARADQAMYTMRAASRPASDRSI
jgi:diguanylate cyclase (GGDEF)-like protein